MKRCKECLDPIPDSIYDYCSACRRRMKEEDESDYGEYQGENEREYE